MWPDIWEEQWEKLYGLIPRLFCTTSYAVYLKICGKGSFDYWFGHVTEMMNKSQVSETGGRDLRKFPHWISSQNHRIPELEGAWRLSGAWSDRLLPYNPTCPLRSTERALLSGPPPEDVRRVTARNRALLVVVPFSRNSLPVEQRTSQEAFQQGLKTFLFQNMFKWDSGLAFFNCWVLRYPNVCLHLQTSGSLWVVELVPSWSLAAAQGSRRMYLFSI